MWLDLKRKKIRQVLVIDEVYEHQKFAAYVLETLNQRTLYVGCRERRWEKLATYKEGR